MRSTAMRLWTLCVFVAALFALPGQAQVYTGSLRGTVADPAGAVIPNADETLTDIAKGFTYSAHSDHAGQFVVCNLPSSVLNQKFVDSGALC